MLAFFQRSRRAADKLRRLVAVPVSVNTARQLIGESAMKKNHPGINTASKPSEDGWWNVWQQEPSGYTSVDARTVGTSGAATVLQANMRQNTTHQRDILWLPASNRVRIGSSTTKSSG
jgi:hypothetical protein